MSVRADVRASELPGRYPIAIPLALFGVALLFRLFDIFVLRLDEQLGEVILSKALGFALIVGYVWWVRRTLSDIGLHSRNLGKAVAIGGGLTVLAFVIAGVAQMMALPSDASLTIAAVDPKTELSGGAGFALFLVLGNVVNSFMEEALFRGVMLTHFLQKMTFWRANLLQAALFAVWHLVWPLKAMLSGDESVARALAQGGTLVLGTFVAGLVYGLLFWSTDSLWAPWIAHFINNTTLNLVLIREATGELAPAVVLSVIVVVVLAFLAFAVGPIARAWKLPQLRAWAAPPVEIVR
jgi:membrane protease YdiL (CAAX protease family)